MQRDSRHDASRLAVVLWKGDVGGAETMSASLAERMVTYGARVGIVFVGSPEPLGRRLEHRGIPYRTLGLERGRNVLRHPRTYAEAVARCGPAGALLVERGFLGAALRAGGYRAPIVSVEHGEFLQRRTAGELGGRARLSRAAGARVVDAEVAVSDFMLTQMLAHAHARRTERIYNGVDPETYVASPPSREAGHTPTVGLASRLVPGKGADHLIHACARVSLRCPVRLLIAGDGPERSPLMALAQSAGGEAAIEFLGVVDDIPALWSRCDVVAVPPDTFEESFSMVTLEAMACGKPIVATRNGAIPELLVDTVTGTLVTRGDISALASAITTYIRNPELARQHGDAARARAIARFHIDASAKAYLALFEELRCTR